MIREKTDYIVIHCAVTPNGDNRFDIEDIRRWHVQNNGWDDVGYHYVITVDGRVQTGRNINEVGSHVKGFNNVSLGICLIGIDKFTGVQWLRLRGLVRQLKKKYPGAQILGHYSKDRRKTCPGFDVDRWIENGFAPDMKNALDPAEVSALFYEDAKSPEVVSGKSSSLFFAVKSFFLWIFKIFLSRSG